VFFHRRLDVLVQQSFTRMRRQRLGQRGGPFLLEGQPAVVQRPDHKAQALLIPDRTLW
jgi:hypothetical protein